MKENVFQYIKRPVIFTPIKIYKEDIEVVKVYRFITLIMPLLDIGGKYGTID